MNTSEDARARLLNIESRLQEKFGMDVREDLLKQFRIWTELKQIRAELLDRAGPASIQKTG